MPRTTAGSLAGLCAALLAALTFGGGCRPTAVGVASAGPRASELYAADGKTLIARFDGDPHAACLAVPVNDWGFYCDYVVAWWQGQTEFGANAPARLDRLRHGGYRIVGSLDVQLQKAAKGQVERQRPTGSQELLTVVSMEPGTGRVRAMAVNRRYAAGPSPSGGDPDNQRPTNQYPDTTQAVFTGGGFAAGLQGGPSFEMFTIVAALEKGIPLDHAIDTTARYESRFVIEPGGPAACDGSHWCPRNSGDPAYLSGRRTMWDALGHAVTTYFVPLEEQVGPDAAVDVARRLGIAFASQGDAELARNARDWGAFTLGVSSTDAVELADAYATLAADGTHCDPLPVREVIGGDNRPVPAAGPHCASVLGPEVARAAMDAGRCPVGDRSAFGDVCGAPAPAAAVRGLVGRPVAGQFGVSDGGSVTLAVSGPQLVTVGLGSTSPWCARCGAQADTLGPPLIQAVAGTEHDGLAGLPVAQIPAPPDRLAYG